MKLINEKELNFLGDNFLGRLSSKILMTLFDINKVNRVYKDLIDVPKERYTAALLNEIGLSYTVSQNDIGNIPKEGAVIIVANHPTGAPDGLLIIDLISKVRPDLKVMGNYVLSRVEPIKDYFIDVDPFKKGAKRTTTGIKASFAHLAKGGALVIFPAGEVSTYQKGFRCLEDREWDDSIIKFIDKCGVPILPVYIGAENSLLFHVAGKIHPILRTALLVHEMLNKKSVIANLRIATPIGTKRTNELVDIKTLKAFIRANIYSLAAKANPLQEHLQTFEEIVPPIDTELLSKEINTLEEMCILNIGPYSLYFCDAPSIPNIINEIGRLREIAFRSVGEGTGKAIDLDKFDTYYRHLFMWDNENQAVVGAYRVGMGAEIMKSHGASGFYTNTLFVMSRPMTDILGACIELGRSFISPDYQKRATPLSMIWKGILYIILSNPNYRYLLGPVTIPGKFTNTSKLLLINNLKEYYFDENIARGVIPTTGIKKLDLKSFDKSKYEGIYSIENIDKLVSDIESERQSVPMLIKKYLLLNSKIIGFNVDPSFNNSLDALTLLDVRYVPEKTIQMLSKELDIDIDLVNMDDYEVLPEHGSFDTIKIKVSGKMKYYQLKILKLKEKFGRLK